MLFLSGLPAGCYAYKSAAGVVLVVPVAASAALPVGVGAYLRGQGCTVLSVRPASLCGRYLGVLLACPGWLAEELLTLPKPPAAGSLGVAALLPWH